MPGEWSKSRKIYPLIISREVEQALVGYRAKHGLSEGKALNILLREALEAEGFLPGAPSKEELARKEKEKDLQWVRDNWWDIRKPEARAFLLKKYPELEAELTRKEDA